MIMLTAPFVLLAAAILAGWLARPRRRGLVLASWLLCLAGTVLLVVLGALGLAGRRLDTGLSVGADLGSLSLHLDPLAGLFLVISFGVALPVLLAALPSPARERRHLAAAVALVLFATALIVLAGDLFGLLTGWELLGFGFYLVVGYDRSEPDRPRSAVQAAMFSKISGAALLVGGLLLAGQAGSLVLARLGGTPGSITSAAYALLVLGFAIKAGLVPAHVWLPPGYSSAPGPARAVLAGVAVNVGFYGLLRTLQVLGRPPSWLVCVVLVVAGVSALLGIAHAAVHAELTGLIAWSSVENAGLIVTAYGVALVGSVVGDNRLIAAGLLAATAQITAHAVGKSVLFTAASAVEADLGRVDLDQLGGVIRTLPAAGTGLAVGSLTLAGMPLTAGFASEWMILESLMQQFRVDDLPLQLCMAAAGVLVALTVGVAGLTFVRLIGLTVFGVSRVNRPGRPRADRAPAFQVAIGLLALACLGLAVVAPLEFAVLGRGLTGIVGDAARGALAKTFILQPVYGEFSALSPTLLWIVIPSYVVLIALLAGAVSGGGLFRVRRAEAWTSGSAGVVGRRGYTSYGFTNPLRRVLAGLLMTRRQLRQHGTIAEPEHGIRVGHLDYSTDVVDVVDHYLYAPLLPALRALVRTVRRLQSGRLEAYMAYMLVALLAVIAVVVWLALS